MVPSSVVLTPTPGVSGVAAAVELKLPTLNFTMVALHIIKFSESFLQRRRELFREAVPIFAELVLESVQDRVEHLLEIFLRVHPRGHGVAEENEFVHDSERVDVDHLAEAAEG